MNIILTILKQQFIGVINISLPLLAVAYFYPNLCFDPLSRLVCAVILGLYVLYLNYRLTKAHADALQFSPTQQYKEKLEQIMQTCGINPATVRLRYGYSDGAIALTRFNTISIDPTLCTLFEDDPEARKVITILEQHILPTLSQERQQQLRDIRNILTPQAQLFIIKHELAHVVYTYSYKKIGIIGIIGTAASYAGITTAVMTYQMWGLWAIVLGMIVGGLLDLLLSYISNFIFTAFAEKQADLFAAQQSSAEEIQSAAEFFQKHQDIINATQDSKSLAGKLPTRIISGHYDGNIRAQYLRALLK